MEDDMAEHLLTTVDNPYNPSTQFDDWYAFDTAAGYNTLSLLGRIIRTSDDLPETEQSLAIEQAIEEIVKVNVSGIHRMIEV
jgi:hypothetical protein